MASRNAPPPYGKSRERDAVLPPGQDSANALGSRSRHRKDSVLDNQEDSHKGKSRVPRSTQIDAEKYDDDDDHHVRNQDHQTSKPSDVQSKNGKDSRHAGGGINQSSLRPADAKPHRQPAADPHFPPPSKNERHFDLSPGDASSRPQPERLPFPIPNPLHQQPAWPPPMRTQSLGYQPPPTVPRQSFSYERQSGDLALQARPSAEPSHLTALGKKFALIRVGQIKECVNFIIQNQTVLKEDAERYLSEAVVLYRKSRTQDARACVQQALVIDHCSDLDIDDIKEYLGDLMASRKSTVNKLLNNVDKKFLGVKAKADAQTNANSSDNTLQENLSNDNRHIVAEPRHISEGRPTHQSASLATSGLANQFSGLSVKPRQLPTPSNPAPSASAGRGRHQTTENSTTSQSSAGYQPSRNSRRLDQIDLRGTEGEFEPLDPRYRQRKDKAEYFIVGRLFAILWHENMGMTKRKPGPEVEFTRDNRFGEKIFSHIRRMIVVRRRYGYCWTVAINTYGGRGLVGKNRSDEEVQSHTVVYDQKGRPALFREEIGLMSKESIAIDLLPGHTLEPASRLNYAKVSTVEHNVKVMDLGMVSDSSMPYFLTHWKDERDD